MRFSCVNKLFELLYYYFYVLDFLNVVQEIFSHKETKKKKN